jgi:hypothetical protein
VARPSTQIHNDDHIREQQQRLARLIDGYRALAVYATDATHDM